MKRLPLSPLAPLALAQCFAVVAIVLSTACGTPAAPTGTSSAALDAPPDAASNFPICKEPTKYATLRFVDTLTCAGACPAIGDDAGDAWRPLDTHEYDCTEDPSKDAPPPGIPCGCAYEWAPSVAGTPPMVGLLDEPGVYVAPVSILL